MLFLLLLASLLVVAARVWFPGADRYKAQLESYLCELTDQNVSIGQLETRFHGLTPSFTAKNVVLREQDQAQPSLMLAAVDADIDLLALLRGKPRVKRLVVESPSLIVQRLPDGRFVVGGVGVGARKQGGDLKRTLARLLDQQRVELHNAHVIWRDMQYPDAPELVLQQADIAFVRERGVHSLSLKADVGELTPHMEIHASISGDVLAGPQAWDGDIEAQVDSLNLGAIPPILASAIPARLQGRVSIKARSGWEKGGIVTGSADIDGARVGVGLDADRNSIRLADFSNRFQWGGRVAENDWELVSRGLDLLLQQPQVHLGGDLRLLRQQGEIRLSLGQLTIKSISPFLDALYQNRNKPAALEKLIAIRPQGRFSKLELRLPQGLDKPELFILGTDVDGFHSRPYGKIPGVAGVSGRLSLTRLAGSFSLDCNNATLEYPRLFSQPVMLDQASANIRWRKDADVWLVAAQQAHVQNEDIEGEGSVEVAAPVDHALSPQLKLNVSYRNGRGEHAARYYPDRIMSPKLVKWLKQSVKAGKVTHGSVKLEGPVRAFPFYHDEGTFIVHADITDATLDYYPGWPAVKNADVSLRFNGPAMTITGTGGTFAEQTIRYANVYMADLRQRDHHLRIQGELTGPAAAVVDFLANGPLRGKHARPLHGWSGSGEGDTALDLDLPLSKPSSLKLTGSYLLRDVALRIPGGIAISHLNNRIEFTENLVQCKNLSGKMLGGDVSIDISTPKPQRFAEVLVQANGSAAPEHLQNFLGETITRALSGKAAWDGAVRITRQGVKLEIRSDLKGLASRAPAPLNKPAKARWPLTLKYSFASKEKDRTRFSIGKRLYGAMEFSGKAENYGLDAAKIVLGSERGDWPGKGMVEVVVDAQQLDADAWLQFFAARSGGSAGESAGRKPGFAEKLNRVSGSVDRFRALSRAFGPLDFSFDRTARGWSGSVSGERAEGKLGLLWSARSKKVDARLKRLYWPKSAKTGSAREKKPRRDRSNLPDISLSVDDTRYEDMKLGRMKLVMKPGRERWEIHKLDLVRPDMTLTVVDQALADSGPKTAQAGNSSDTQLGLQLKSTDVAATLAALGYPDQIVARSADVNGLLFWRGGLEDFRWEILNANLKVDLRQGRILRVNPGLGRMLGALNLESLLRRLKLDFTDVFDKGFAFDKIAGDVRIRSGEGFTDELVISGPGANIILSGRTALVDRTYNMRVTVIPPLGGNASLVGFALGGPAAGVLIWLGDKLLKHPLGKLIHYEYKVTGTWDKPVVEPLGAVEKGELPDLTSGVVD